MIKSVSNTIKEFFDDVIYYIYNKPMNLYHTTRGWYRTDASNPWHWKLVWYSLFHNRPWDRYYLFNVMYLQLNKSLYYFKNREIYISDEHKREIIRWQQIAVNLLETILEKRDIWDYNIEKHEYKCLVYVNPKNINRFPFRTVNYETNKVEYHTEYLELQLHELYINKAIYLLMRILNERSDEWWD